MMQPEEKGRKSDLVKYRLDSEETDLRSSRILLDADDYKGANNRAYYSIYHSIAAVLAMDGEAYKRHKDAIGNFNRKYVKSEIFSRELGRRIGHAFEIRNASDYNDFYIAVRSETEEQIATAEELLATVREYCQLRNYGDEN